LLQFGHMPLPHRGELLHPFVPGRRLIRVTSLVHGADHTGLRSSLTGLRRFDPEEMVGMRPGDSYGLTGLRRDILLSLGSLRVDYVRSWFDAARTRPGLGCPSSRASRVRGNPGFLQSLAGAKDGANASVLGCQGWRGRLGPWPGMARTPRSLLGLCVRQNQRGSPVFPDYTPLVSVSGAVNPNCGASILQLTPSVPMSYRD